MSVRHFPTTLVCLIVTLVAAVLWWFLGFVKLISVMILFSLVYCMKSTADREIDKEIYDYIVENSWDNSHFYLKYNGYPLVEEFYVSTDRNGKYIVSQ